ncbi:hypothetical protein [Methylocystis sp. ATCC 49242]|uniref:hypothetical protein n=1 Tax=Methylocystis sp. ATCC 49242 TaxID=622637 RepID=UPI0001F86EDB|nr:hypothetical protein [Methylocystis sp. ATCC 49242]
MRPHYEAIKKLLVEDKLSISEIQERYKDRMKPDVCRNLIKEITIALREEGIEFLPPPRRRGGGFKPLGNTPAISQAHLSVGVRLNTFRQTKQDLQPAEFCKKYSFANHIRIRQMELGQYDFSLTELQRIASIIEIPVEELVKPFIKNVYAA